MVKKKSLLNAFVQQQCFFSAVNRRIKPFQTGTAYTFRGRHAPEAFSPGVNNLFFSGLGRSLPKFRTRVWFKRTPLRDWGYCTLTWMLKKRPIELFTFIYSLYLLFLHIYYSYFLSPLHLPWHLNPDEMLRCKILTSPPLQIYLSLLPPNHHLPW